MKQSKSFSASSLQTLMVRFAVLGGTLVGSIITTRWLGPKALGVYYLVALVPQMGFRFGNLGFGTAISYFAARDKATGRELHRLSWGLGFLLAGASVLTLVAVRGLEFSPWRDVDPALFYLFLVAVPLEFWILFSQRLLHGKLRITEANVSALLLQYGDVALLVLLVVVFDLGLPGALSAMIGAMLAANLWLLGRTRPIARQAPQAEHGTPGLIGEMWRYGRWTYLVLLANFVCVQLPLLVMARLCSTEAIAFYSVAAALVQKSELITVPFGNMILPFTAAAEAGEAARRTNVLCRVFASGMLILAGLMAAAVTVFIPLLFGREYAPAVIVFWAAAPGILFWPLDLFLGLHVVASGKPRSVFLADLGALAVATVACAVLIPRYGAVGAGLCYGCITASRFLFRLISYRRLTGARLGEILVARRSDWVHSGRALSSFARSVRKRVLP